MVLPYVGRTKKGAADISATPLLVKSRRLLHAAFDGAALGGTLLGHAGEFHLAEAESDTHADIAAGEFAVGGAGIVGIDHAGVPGAPVEDVVDVQVDRHAAVEEVGVDTQVYAFVRFVDVEEALGAATVVGIGKKLIVFPQLDPRVEAETIAPHAVLVGGLAGAVDHIQVIVIERGIESDAGKATGAISDVGVEAGSIAIAHVDGLAVMDHTAEEVAIDHVGERALLVDIAGIVGFESHASELVEILVPLSLDAVGIGGHQIGVASVVVFEIVANIGAQVVSAGLRGAVGIAEAEVVHVFGVVAQMQRGGESEKGRVEVTGGVVVVNHAAGLIIGA